MIESNSEINNKLIRKNKKCNKYLLKNIKKTYILIPMNLLKLLILYYTQKMVKLKRKKEPWSLLIFGYFWIDEKNKNKNHI